MIQTSKRGQKRRTSRKRAYAMAQPQYNETHPLGNRATRRHQAKLDRTLLSRLRKEGFQRHLRNLRESAVKGYNIRMAKIAERKLVRTKQL